MVRIPTDQEFGQWRIALESQTADNVKATYVTPVPESPPHPRKVRFRFFFEIIFIITWLLKN